VRKKRWKKKEPGSRSSRRKRTKNNSLRSAPAENLLAKGDLSALLRAVHQFTEPAGLKEIREAAAIGLEPKKLKKLLNQLCEQNLLQCHGKQYAINRKSVVQGSLSVNPRGFGFVTPDQIRGQQDDIFIPARKLTDAIHGDQVLLIIGKGRGRGRSEGEIIAITSRGNDEIIGILQARGKQLTLVPEDEHFPFTITLDPQTATGAQDGDCVICQLEENRKQGRIIQVLGDPDTVQVQTEITIYNHKLRRNFPPACRQQATGLDPRVRPNDDRLDLRDIFHLTIDSESARDFDDAVAIEKTKMGFRLHVSIADVSHYVKPGSALDQEAYLRGTSTYFPTRVLPMLPEELSNELCSLKEGLDRYAFTAVLDFDRKGRRQKMSFARSIINSKRRLTYNLVSEILTRPEKAAGEDDLLGHLKPMACLAEQLNHNRVKRGSINLELGEARLEIDPDHDRVQAVNLHERNIAHKIIEEFMLAANEAVAETLAKSNLDAIFRIHETPSALKVEELTTFVQSLGLDSEQTNGSCQWFQDLIRQSEERAYIINNMILRVMQQARYSPDNSGHFALAASYYSHFTSPIRRYPDLMVHRQLANILSQDKKTAKDSALTDKAEHLSIRERVSMKAEREVMNRLKAMYMADRIGQTFTGVISGITSFAIFVELTDSLISGAIMIEDLAGHSFHVDEKNHILLALGSGHSYHLGDPVTVELIHVDRRRQRINFILHEES